MANHQKHNRRGTNKRTRSYGQLEEYFVSLLHTKQQLEVEGPQEETAQDQDTEQDSDKTA